jgi:hypothetical protein
VKCEQFRRPFGAEISLTIRIPSVSGPDVCFACISIPDSSIGLTAPRDQYNRWVTRQPDSFEDVPDTNFTIVEKSVRFRAKVTKLRIKRVTREARVRKTPTNALAVDQCSTGRFISKQPESTDLDLSSPLAPTLSNSSPYYIRLPGFEDIDRLSREGLTNSSIPVCPRLPGLDPSTKSPLGA